MNSGGISSANVDRWLSRRRLLQLGTTAAVLGLAGCQEDSGEGSDDDNDDEGNPYKEFNSTVETVMQLPGVVAAVGSMDIEEIGQWALDGERQGAVMSEGDDIGAYSLYEVADDAQTGVESVAVSEDHLLLSFNRDALTDAMQAIGGEGERATETYEDFGWLLSAVGDGGFVYSGYIPESERSDENRGSGPRRSATGYAVSMTAADGQTRASFAAVYPELTGELESEIRSTVGQDADSRSVAVDGTRAVVEATYDRDLITVLAELGDEEQLSFAADEPPETTEESVPDSDPSALPRISEYATVAGSGLAQGISIDEGPFRTIEDGSREALDSEDLLLSEPLRIGISLHNDLGQRLLFPFPFFFRIIFGIEELNN